MSDTRTFVFRASRIVWLAAWAVLLHALLRRFAPAAPLGTWIFVLLVAGALLETSPLRARGGRRRGLEVLLGALCLAALGIGLRFLVDAIAAEGGGQGLPWLAPWIALGLLLLLEAPSLRRLGPLLAVEGLKMWRSRLFLAAALGTLGVTLLVALTHQEIEADTGWSVASHVLGAGFLAAEVLLLVLGAVAISGEATQGTLKMMLPHAYRRSDWIAAKVIVLLGAAVVLAVLVVGVAVGHAALDSGLGDVTQPPPYPGAEEGLFQTADVMRGHLVDTILACFAALVTAGLLGVFLSCLFDSVVPSLCTAFLLFAGLKSADVFLGLESTTLKDLYTWYPQHWREVLTSFGRAYSDHVWEEALHPEGIRLAFLTCTLALLLAVRVLAHRDVHA